MEQPVIKTHIVNSIETFEKLVNYETEVDTSVVVLDVETNSVVVKTADLYGIGICFNLYRAFYIPWRKPTGEKYWKVEEEQIIIDWLDNITSRRGVIGHNLIFDTLVIENNLRLNLESRILSDTILMKHVLQEERPFALKELAVREFGDWADKAQEQLKEEVVASGGKWNKEQKDMYLASTEILGEYCCWDVVLNLMLYEKYQLDIEQEKLEKLFYEEEVMPLYKEVTINMKRKGFKINLEYFKILKKEIDYDIYNLEQEMYSKIENEIKGFEKSILEKEFPVKNKGNFPKALAEILDVPLPIVKGTGKVTLAKKAIEKQREACPEHKDFYDWLIENKSIKHVANSKELSLAQKAMYESKFETDKIFNFKSNDHLAHLFFKILKMEPLSKTEKGKPQTDDNFLKAIRTQSSLAAMLLDYKKLIKLSSTYVEGILDRQIEEFIYTDMLQYGTTSGRFSSRDPNCQNLPSIKDEDSGLSERVLRYTNAIRKGFIAPKGYKIVNADYSQLEPCCFAHVSKEKSLQRVFHLGEDLYSRVAIDVNKLKGYSAFKKDDNYLGKQDPNLRKLWKPPVLGIVYGMEASKLSGALNCSFKQASKIIRAYLNTYPGLKVYMNKCAYAAKKTGKITTEFGRIRHLPEAQTTYLLEGDKILDYKHAKKHGKTDIRWKFKNALNNAKNYPIQGLAAHVVNRAMIKTSREFKKNNIDGWIALQVHDEITCIVREDHVELATNILRDCMENVVKLDVPLKAEPVVADNWGDAK